MVGFASVIDALKILNSIHNEPKHCVAWDNVAYSLIAKKLVMPYVFIEFHNKMVNSLRCNFILFYEGCLVVHFA